MGLLRSGLLHLGLLCSGLLHLGLLCSGLLRMGRLGDAEKHFNFGFLFFETNSQMSTLHFISFILCVI